MKSGNTITRTKPRLDDDLLGDQGECLVLRCKQCPKKDSRIRLDFTVDEKKKILVNGFELYPSHDGDLDPLMTAIVENKGVNATETHEEAINYKLSIADVEKDETEKIELIDIHYNIHKVGRVTVKEVPTVHMRLIKLSTEELLIGILSTKEKLAIFYSRATKWGKKIVRGRRVPHWNKEAFGNEK
ncbi:hypothetical protein QQS21_005444 [Conoideocrella luteorostrata]|uniref:DUF7728 domain-containing protein n=1 Tax=Conoideocrella luteorostrata TaxID=1105319 RepID=A0AAJ0FTU0_9HYPO|nr:hypothetical protein QQS21_005444 [Conoideocrella luteorostrata]